MCHVFDGENFFDFEHSSATQRSNFMHSSTSVRNKQSCPIKNMAHITVTGFIVLFEIIEAVCIVV